MVLRNRRQYYASYCLDIRVGIEPTLCALSPEPESLAPLVGFTPHILGVPCIEGYATTTLITFAHLYTN